MVAHHLADFCQRFAFRNLVSYEVDNLLRAEAIPDSCTICVCEKQYKAKENRTNRRTQ